MANHVGDNNSDAVQKAVLRDGSGRDEAGDACRQALFEANPMNKVAQSAEVALQMPSFGHDGAAAALPSRYFTEAMAQLNPTPRLNELSLASRFSVADQGSRSTAIEHPNHVQKIQHAISQRNTMLG